MCLSACVCVTTCTWRQLMMVCVDVCMHMFATIIIRSDPLPVAFITVELLCRDVVTLVSFSLYTCN